MYESFKEIILIKDSLKRNLHINTKKVHLQVIREEWAL